MKKIKFVKSEISEYIYYTNVTSDDLELVFRLGEIEIEDEKEEKIFQADDEQEDFTETDNFLFMRMNEVFKTKVLLGPMGHKVGICRAHWYFLITLRDEIFAGWLKLIYRPSHFRVHKTSVDSVENKQTSHRHNIKVNDFFMVVSSVMLKKY